MGLVIEIHGSVGDLDQCLFFEEDNHFFTESIFGFDVVLLL